MIYCNIYKKVSSLLYNYNQNPTVLNFKSNEIKFLIKLTAVYLFIFILGIVITKITIDHIFDHSDTVKIVSSEKIGNPILKQTKKV